MLPFNMITTYNTMTTINTLGAAAMNMSSIGPRGQPAAVIPTAPRGPPPSTNIMNNAVPSSGSPLVRFNKKICVHIIYLFIYSL